MISTKLFPGWNARLHAQGGYFTIHGDKNAPLDELMPDYDIHRCNRIGVEATHTKPQPGTLRQGAH